MSQSHFIGISDFSNVLKPFANQIININKITRRKSTKKEKNAFKHFRDNDLYGHKKLLTRHSIHHYALFEIKVCFLCVCAGIQTLR